MRCPVDRTTLALAECHAVEIDYCPQCRGIWLDRGELDRILNAAARDVRGRDRERGHHEHHDHRHDHADRDDEHRHHHDDDDEDGRFTGHHSRSGRKRGGAFFALSDLLGGGD
jgi:Zn-finger nucleic acid-binding protein